MPWPITTSVIAIHRALSHSGTRGAWSGSSDAASSASTHSTAPVRRMPSAAAHASRRRSAGSDGRRQNGRMSVLRAVVTGASSGIGAATVRALRAAGWDVVGRRPPRGAPAGARRRRPGHPSSSPTSPSRRDVDALARPPRRDRARARPREQRGRREGARLRRGVRRRRLGVDVRGQRARRSSGSRARCCRCCGGVRSTAAWPTS